MKTIFFILTVVVFFLSSCDEQTLELVYKDKIQKLDLSDSHVVETEGEKFLILPRKNVEGKIASESIRDSCGYFMGETASPLFQKMKVFQCTRHPLDVWVGEEETILLLK